MQKSGRVAACDPVCIQLISERKRLVRQTKDLPPVLQAVVALDAWNDLSVLQQAPWLG